MLTVNVRSIGCVSPIEPNDISAATAIRSDYRILLLGVAVFWGGQAHTVRSPHCLTKRIESLRVDISDSIASVLPYDHRAIGIVGAYLRIFMHASRKSAYRRIRYRIGSPLSASAIGKN